MSDEEELEEAHKEAFRMIYRGSLYATVKDLLGYKDLTWPTHGGTIKALEADTTRKLLILPRGSFKSSIAVVGYAIWCLLRDPNERIIIDSEIFQNSKNFLREIRAHLENPKVTNLFGTFRTEDNWAQGSLTIAQRTKSYKESSIICGGLGTIKVGAHYSKYIMDDMNSNKNSETAEGLEKVIRHYQYAQSILDPGGTMVVIGTRYASRDLVGYIMNEEIGLGESHPKNGEYETRGFL